MPVTELTYLTWANAVEDTRLPVLESQSAINTAEISSLRQTLTDRLDQHSVRISTAQAGADDAYARAVTTGTTVYQTGLDAQLYTDQKIQLLRDELLGKVTAIETNVPISINDKVQAELGNFVTEADRHRAELDAANLALQTSLNTEIADVRSTSNDLLNIHMPAQDGEIQRIDLELSGEKTLLSALRMGMTYGSVAEEIDALRTSSEARLTEYAYAKADFDGAVSAKLSELSSSMQGGRLAAKTSFQDEKLGDWSLQNAQGGTLTVATVTGDPKARGKALKHTGRDAYHNAFQSGDVAGRSYRMTGYVHIPKAAAVPARIGLLLLHVDGTVSFEGRTVGSAGSSAWVFFDTTITVPTNLSLKGYSPALRNDGLSGATLESFWTEIAYFDTTQQTSVETKLTNDYLTKTDTNNAIAGAETRLNASIAAQDDDILTLSGDVSDIKALDLNKLTGTALGSFEQKVRVSVDRGDGVLTNQFMKAGWGNWNTGAVVSSVAANAANGTPEKNVWDFNITDVNTNAGMMISSHHEAWVGSKNADAYTVEILVELVSGTMGGAGIVMDWINTANAVYRDSADLLKMSRGQVLVLGQVQRLSYTFVKPKTWVGPFSFHNLHVMANYGSDGFVKATKHLRIHRVLVRNANYSEAEVLSQGIALSDLDGNASASFVMRAKAGSAVAEAELVAFKDAKNPAAATSGIRFTADKILLDGTVFAKSLAVGLGGNLLEDSTWSKKTRTVTRSASDATLASQSTVYWRAPGQTYAGLKYPTLQVHQVGTHQAELFVGLHPVGDPIDSGAPATAGKTYSLSGHMSTIRCDAQLAIIFRGESGIQIGPAIRTTSLNNTPGSSSSPDSWAKRSVVAVAPTGTGLVQFAILKGPTYTGQADSHVFLHKPMLAEVQSGATEAAAYHPAGATRVVGDQIETGTITAESGILANAAVGTLTVAGEAISATRSAIATYSTPKYATTDQTLQNFTFTTPTYPNGYEPKYLMLLDIEISGQFDGTSDMYIQIVHDSGPSGGITLLNSRYARSNGIVGCTAFTSQFSWSGGTFTIRVSGYTRNWLNPGNGRIGIENMKIFLFAGAR